MRRIYKLLDRAAWESAKAAGVFAGSPVDTADGFIHFSTAEQAAETARRHFAGQKDLVILTVDADTLGPVLRWEPSRGGDLFPHLYSPLSTVLVIGERRLNLGEDGAPDVGVLQP